MMKMMREMSTQQVSYISLKYIIHMIFYAFICQSFLMYCQPLFLNIPSDYWNVRSKVRRLQATKEKIKKKKKKKIFQIIIPILACQRRESSSIKRKYVRAQSIFFLEILHQ